MVPKEKDSPGKETAIFAGIQPTQSQCHRRWLRVDIITGSCWLINKKNTLEKKNVIYNLSQLPFVGGKSSSKPDVGIYVGGRVGDKMGTRDELVLIILPVLTYRTPKKTGRQDGIRYR